MSKTITKVYCGKIYFTAVRLFLLYKLIDLE
jgi:hypothetical protein